MLHEKEIIRDNGDVIKIVTMLSANVFIESGFEQEQFLLVKKTGKEEWEGVYHKWTPKSISRKEYIDNIKPTTVWGLISYAEAIKASQEARELFFK